MHIINIFKNFKLLRKSKKNPVNRKTILDQKENIAHGLSR
jgi:hypothetical protein